MNLKPGKEKPSHAPINERIRFPKMQLITHEGENIGVVSRDQALRAAQEAGLDLVLITEQGSMDVPVVKVMDYGKALYEKKKKQTEAKKHQKTIQVKELKIRPKIGDHDLETKMKQASEFLKKGMHLKITLAFRGREMVNKEERGNELFVRIHTMLEEFGIQDLMHEKDAKAGPFWTRIYYVKPSKK